MMMTCRSREKTPMSDNLTTADGILEWANRVAENRDHDSWWPAMAEYMRYDAADEQTAAYLAECVRLSMALDKK